MFLVHHRRSVVRHQTMPAHPNEPLCSPQGYFKLLGTGKLPKQPVIVKARSFTQGAEKKIKAAGGACVLVA